MELSPFVLFTSILIATLGVLAILKVVRLPTLPAYFIAGILLGPDGLGILDSSETAHFIGELGIVLLLFTIGLKFNINSLQSIRYYVFFLGSLQVLLTALVFALPAWYFVGDPLLASLIGFVAALSSTAIVSQLLLEQNAVASPFGRRAIAVLLLQDLIVIPLIIIYSNEGGEHSLWITSLLLAMKIAAVLVVVMMIAPVLIRHWLNWAARYGDRELFIINIVGIISLFSMLTGVFGLSYVLGGFLAGILIAETFHRYRVEQIIEPFRQLFLGFFFITLGILIHPQVLADNILLILLLTLLLFVVKLPVIYACSRWVRSHQVTSARTAILLAGSGEFGFVLMAVAYQSEILPYELFQLLVPVNMLAMLITPIIWLRSDQVIRKLFPEDWKYHAERIRKNLESTQGLHDHIIICGFGRTGQAISGVLRAIGVKQYIVIEADHVIMEAAGKVEQLIYGSGDRKDSLLAAGILRAKALIVAYHEPIGAVLTVQIARELAPDLYIIAKTTSRQQAEILRQAGADEVLVEAHESGFVLVEKCVRRFMKDSVWMLDHTLAGVRSGTNRLFSGEYAGTEPEKSDTHLMGYRVQGGQKLTLADIPEEVEIIAWRRAGTDMALSSDSRQSGDVLQENDELVLLGTYWALEQTQAVLGQESAPEPEPE